MIAVRGTAVAAKGSTLSVASEVGDVALVVYHGQFKSAGDSLPGWERLAGQDDTQRSNSVYVRQVTDSAQTQGVTPWDTRDTYTGRQVAALVVLSGAAVPDLTGLAWSSTAPESVPDGALLLAGGDGAATNKWGLFTGGETVVAGQETVSAAASWSAVAVARQTGGLAVVSPNNVKGWLVLPITEYGEPEPVTYTVTLADGSEAAATVWDGRAESVPSRIAPMPRGARTVAELLAKPKFIVAHRGGSGSWPEHTKRAYTQAVAHGVDALEISCGRSSDGVWFGAHDKSLERVGGPATDVSELTWAEIEAAMEGTGYMPARLDWLLDAYAESHTIVFDPKYEADRNEEYGAILAPYKDNVIIKYSGDGNWRFGVFKGAGFTTWAYGYTSWKVGQSSAWTNLTTDVNKDILSMQYNADQTIWDELNALGKPVTSHIPPDAAAVEAGWAVGAVGSIVSGVADYLPTSV